MIKNNLTCLLLLFSFSVATAQSKDSIVIRKIYTEALTSGKAYDWLDYLSNKIGARLSGSPQAANAVEWGADLFSSLKVNVIKQECMVPHWVRGEKEEATIIPDKIKTLVAMHVPICALGGSIATPANGITAKVVEVKSFDELEKLERKNIEGKIVFFNGPMDPAKINTFMAYGAAVEQRWAGAMKAAPYGAVGVVVRSMTLALDDYPHTGSMGYADTIPKIPACAISTSGANQLSDMLKNDPQTKFKFKMSCQTLPDEKSYNVIGEIKGSEYPDEYIIVGGHLDSWDLAQGASDDGTGVVQAAEVLNLFQTLGIKPKRTIRAVMFMNEENGSRGGEKYAELAKSNKEKHIAAIESDGGGFTPRGFSFKGDTVMVENILQWSTLFEPYKNNEWTRGYGGADINHLAENCTSDCTLLVGLSPDSQRYFDYHHAATDTFDKVNRRELELGAASMAALVYLLDTYGVK